jgi:hypothetical protein
MNGKNSRVGYWFNLVVVSLTDLGFIGGIVDPGAHHGRRRLYGAGFLRPGGRVQPRWFATGG